MPDEEKMTIDERRKYLRLIRKRYLTASKLERGRLLDEMEVVTGLHRKSLIRLISSDLKRKPRRKHRGRTYAPEVDDALRVIFESFDHLCAERLQPNLVWMATHLAHHGELEISQHLLVQLSQISVSTVKRILRRIEQDEPHLPRRGPSRGNEIIRDVPMERIAWNEQQPGHFEADLVHHCGSSASGEYVHTIQIIDVATAWSERVAVLGRSYLVMEGGFRRILTCLPFPIWELHPDNGSEFLNDHLVLFWKESIVDLQFSRNRPCQKNDNRFVEQKQSTLVRACLGYDRLDSVAQTHALNQLYDMMWLYYNFFSHGILDGQPVIRVTEKIIASAQGQYPRVKRRYGQARTPLDRICETDAISQEQKKNLLSLRDQVNLRKLRQDIYHQIDYIFSLPGAKPRVTENVYQTLSQPIQIVKGEGASATFLFDWTRLET